ncbi:MAG: LCP family protein [Solirubrobacteraceae bacterium]
MSSEPNDRAPTEDPPSPPFGERPYRTYRAQGGEEPGERPYRTYRSLPRGLRARLRGEEEIESQRGRPAGPAAQGPGSRRWWRRRLTPWRVLAYLVAAVVAWLALSFVLFVISAEQQSGSIPKRATAALTSGGNMLTSTDTVLVLGTDQRPKGTHEAGADTSDKGSRSDTIMLWRIGGGTSRRLSIPRDTLVTIPGHGQQKINAAYAIGGPALAIRTIESFTGVKINHLIIVNLANFPKFIDAIGGITVHTGRICSNISGGASNGGFTLNLRRGVHHLNGIQALTLARTRENACNAASTDLTREGYQQQILNGIKSKLLSPSTFFHLPWASWYAPQAVRTDMGPLTLMTLFAASEMGGSAPTRILKPSGGQYVPGIGDSLIASPSDVHRAVRRLLRG